MYMEMNKEKVTQVTNRNRHQVFFLNDQEP